LFKIHTNFETADKRVQRPIQQNLAGRFSYQPSSAFSCGFVFLSILSVDHAVGGNAFFVLVANGEELVFGNDVVAALLEMKLIKIGLDNRVDRAGFLAEPAIDAFEQVDVVARGPARAVGALVRFDRDRRRRAHGFAELTGDATLLAVRVAPQRVQAAKARADRRSFIRILNRDLSRE
jgi:hypothetical protein